MPLAGSWPRWRGQPRPLHWIWSLVRRGKVPTLTLRKRVVARLKVQLIVSLTRRERARGLGVGMATGTGTVTTGAVVVVVVVTGGAGGVGAGQVTAAGAFGASDTPEPLW